MPIIGSSRLKSTIIRIAGINQVSVLAHVVGRHIQRRVIAAGRKWPSVEVAGQSAQHGAFGQRWEDVWPFCWLRPASDRYAIGPIAIGCDPGLVALSGCMLSRQRQGECWLWFPSGVPVIVPERAFIASLQQVVVDCAVADRIGGKEKRATSRRHAASSSPKIR